MSSVKERVQEDNWISDIVGALCDPVIVMPNGWGDTLPKEIKTQITMERLIMNLKGLHGEEMTGTDAEACAYLYTRSLEAPMPHEWVKIYMYVFNKTMALQKKELPEDMKCETLTDYEMGLLAHFKRWLYQKRTEHRQEQDRARRRAERNNKEVEQQDPLLKVTYEQIALL